MALVWGVVNVINVAQGELVMLGGYAALELSKHGVPALATVPLAAAVLFAVGWLLYRMVIYRVVGRDIFFALLATFGLSILIQQLANHAFGADIQSMSTDMGSFILADGVVTVGKVKVLAFGVALAVGALLVFFLRATRLGQAIRATSQNPRAARVVGIDTDRIYAMTFAVNSAICGAAGALVAMTWVIHPYLGLTYTLRAFMIVVVAGIGNIGGVLAAGAGLGVAENTAGFAFGTEYQTAFIFALLVAILVARNLRLRRSRRYLR
jgi:branched-chain amino acid transport system permease protein